MPRGSAASCWPPATTRASCRGSDGPELHKGVDPGKDQSYFLHAVRRESFANVVMPLGEMHKDEVRDMARAAGLPVAGKRDSTGICFIGERPFREFLEEYVPHQPGPILTAEGEPLGEHIGLPFYTLGQRGGIGIGGRRDGSGAPWYVVGKRTSRQHAGGGTGRGASRACTAGSWQPAQSTGCAPRRRCSMTGITVRLRYRQEDQPARVELAADGGVAIEPRQPQRAVTPGQSAVLYRDTRCLGGGVIVQTGL